MDSDNCNYSICKICGEPFSGKHVWNNHSVKQSEYFYQYFPRRSKLTGELIVFKNIEQYFNSDFQNTTERNTWIKNNIEEGKEYILDLLMKRKIKKNWVYAPGETLLKLCDLPSVLWFEKTFDLSYEAIVKKLDFKLKYNSKDINLNWSAAAEIIIDSREQKSLNFPTHIRTTIKKLNFGDYALLENEKIAIERKSIGDFGNTLSGGYERFKREIKRAKRERGYIVILVESPINDFRSIEYLPQTKYASYTYEFLSKRARDLYEEFDCFQIVFANGRKHAAKIVEFILKLGKDVKKVDIQLLIHKKII